MLNLPSRALIGLVALMSLGASSAVPSEQGGLGWSDWRFWNDDSDFDSRAVDLFDETEFEGLFLDGPRRASLREHEDIPLVAIRASSLRDHSAIGLEQRGVLLTTRLESGETLAALTTDGHSKDRVNKTHRSAHNKYDAPEPEPKRGPDSLPEGRSVDLHHLKLSDPIPEVATRSGTWLTRLLLFNQHSNLVTTHVEDMLVRPSKRNFEEGYPARPPAPVNPVGEPYRVRPDSPPLPSDVAIVLAGPNTVNKAEEQSWVLRGSFRLPALTRTDVPVTIVLTGSGEAKPILVPLRVPIYQRLELVKGQRVACGHFAVDPLAVVGREIGMQDYAVWAVSRQQISLPIIVRVNKG